MEGGRQAELRQGCRQRPGREGGSAQAGMQRMPGEGCGQCPGGKEAAPGKGGRECPERAAGIRQRHRLLPGLWGGADGKRPSHVPPAVCWVQRRHPFPPRRPAASLLSCPPRTSPPGQTPSGEAGRTPPGESFPPPPPLLAVLLGTSLHLLLRQPPARGQGWGFLCARGGHPEPGLVAGPTKGGTFLLQCLHFWVTRHGAFTCVLDRGKMLAAPPGTWSGPPGHAADGLPAPQAPLRLTVTPASTEVSPRVWLRPHGLG